MVLDSIIINKWDADSNDWVMWDFRLVFTYDANGNQTEYSAYWWYSEINDWVGIYRYVDVYDVNGNRAEVITINGIQKPMTG